MVQAGTGSIIQRLDHIGIIVYNIEKSAEQYKRAFGAEVEKIETVGNNQLKIAFIRAGDSWIELIQPLTDNDIHAQFLRTHGEGLHHIAFEVQDVEKSLLHMKLQGLQVIDDSPRPGANSATIAFLSNDFGGALVEILQFQSQED